MTLLIFGERWDAPITEDATVLPETPTYARCTRCHDLFAEGDQGLVMPMLGEVDPDYLIGLAGAGGTLVGTHRECQLSEVVGHLVRVCSCTGYDTTARETGREVLRRVDAGALHR